MEQDAIKLQIQDWLCRKTASVGVREVLGFPLAVASDIGNVRAENQDKAVILRAQVSSNKFFLVGILCDGMGGMEEGADCASLAVASFISSCIRNRNLQIKDRLLQGVELANQEVYNKYNGDGGATLTAFILDSDEQFEAINVGDSRIYVGQRNSLSQVSVDDTIAGQLNQQSPASQLSNKLLQFVGIGGDIEPHLLDMPSLHSVEKVLLTSDGIHYIDESTLQSISMQKVTSLELSKRLIHVAKWCGGHDNSTIIALSDLASLFNSPENVRTGTVQLWDAFGDVQFIGIEKSPSYEQRLVAQPVAADVCNTSLEESDSPIESSEPELTETKKTVRRRKRKKVDAVEPKKAKKPQLRIDFDD